MQINYMRFQRKMPIVDKANIAALRKLPDITVPKLTSDNYDIFTKAFCSVVVSTIGINGIPVDYVMPDFTGNHNYPWTNQADKLKKISCTPEILSVMTTSLCTRLILSISAPKVLVPIISTSTILKILVVSVTRNFSCTFGMMIILPIKQPLLQGI